MLERWWIYQRERFPLIAHGPLIGAFSFSAVALSSLLGGRATLPAPKSILVAFVSCLLFFLELRIADEFKDHEEDCRFRPYRPVPRGLIRLRELGAVGAACALVQLGLALWLDSILAILLALVWAYLGLMSREFFAREWLRARPLAYLWTHMLIMPQIDLYATACEWRAAGAAAPPGLGWFLAASFCNGVVIEIGRKIRAPRDEERGVPTYSSLWGTKNAVLAWLLALAATGAASLMAAHRIDFLAPAGGLVSVLLAAAAFASRSFLLRPEAGRGQLFERLSGCWTLLVYLSLGPAPLLLRSMEVLR